MQQLPPGFLVGCDPELFVLDDKGNLVSAAGLIPGTKEEPFKVPGGAIQVDGMAVELNGDPTDNFNDFWNNVQKCRNAIVEHLPKGYSLLSVPSVEFSKEVFDAAPEDAKILGCTPDWNAWEMAVNPVPDTENTPYLRTAAGHLHFGWTEDADVFDSQHMMHCFDLVKQLDWYLGAWSVGVDKDKRRRELYGKSGACRVKSYGVEYRVLSNFWVDNYDAAAIMWNRAVCAVRDMPKKFYPEHNKAHDKMLREMIDKSEYNLSLAKHYRRPIQVM